MESALEVVVGGAQHDVLGPRSYISIEPLAHAVGCPGVGRLKGLDGGDGNTVVALDVAAQLLMRDGFGFVEGDGRIQGWQRGVAVGLGGGVPDGFTAPRKWVGR